MLNSVNIENFKCFIDKKINLKPVTVLVGANGSGKSSVVQALLLAREAIEQERISSGVGQELDISINGPFMLQMGQASSVFANPSIPKIKVTLEDTNEITKEFSFTFDGRDASHLLKGMIGSSNEDHLSGEFQYLHAERLGPRKSLDMPSSSWIDIGCQGEFVYHSIYLADTMKTLVHDALRQNESSTKFSHQVESWMQFLFPHLKFQYETVNDLNKLTMKFSNAAADTRYCSPPNTGFGISYTLPIVTAGLKLSTGTNPVLIVENPEAHLHPMGQSRIGRYLALLSLAGVQVIVETHSEHVINGIRIFMARSGRAKDLGIQYFSQDDEGIRIELLELKENGELTDWPVGFFDQEQNDLKELMFLKREKGSAR
ncbi:AAA family ATPase [Paenibacillus sp. MBLB4367]|uniref:AAA family ATPase n=1 Tax=Paenibacillus sp. MBLB4367 TaxID=3384767 RepID=UPI0039083551